MSLTRRDFLRLIALGVVAQELDIERLLWVPGEKTIFLPTNPTISLSQIVATEIERMLPKIRTLFERDDIFYRHMVEEMSFTKDILITDRRRVN
jgi:hypothetical protein